MSRANVILCAPEIPELDRQSGSRRLFHHVELLREAGTSVTVLAENLGTRLDQLRIRRLGAMLSDLRDLPELARSGRYDLAIVAFWHLAEDLLPVLREEAPGMPVAIDSIDLDFVRSARGPSAADSNGSGVPLGGSLAARQRRELQAYGHADLVFTVSEREADIVRDLTGDASSAVCVPDWEEFPVSDVPFEDRRNILFVGNFRHPPNGEALEFLCSEMMPKIDRAALGSHEAQIVGHALGGEDLELCRRTKSVTPVGFVPDVHPYFAAARVFVAPLLSGAGTKRKLIQALMTGVPTVATPVAAEGLDVVDGDGALISDTADGLAERVGRLLSDKAEWDRVASSGRERIRRNHSLETGRAALLGALEPLVGGGEDNVMKRDWDERARSNAMHFIASGQEEWDEADFFESGRQSVSETVTGELDELCRGEDPASMRMLEIGCGIGRMTRHLAGVFGEVHAVDVSAEMVRRAREKLADLPNVHVYETSGRDLAALEDDYFDFAFSFIVFQHVPEKEAIVGYFREVHRTLRPGRVFKFQVQGQPMEETDTWLGAGFDAEELTALAEEIGFTRLRSEGEGTQYHWNWWRRD